MDEDGFLKGMGAAEEEATGALGAGGGVGRAVGVAEAGEGTTGRGDGR